jgi:hypothetical protein
MHVDNQLLQIIHIETRYIYQSSMEHLVGRNALLADFYSSPSFYT